MRDCTCLRGSCRRRVGLHYDGETLPQRLLTGFSPDEKEGDGGKCGGKPEGDVHYQAFQTQRFRVKRLYVESPKSFIHLPIWDFIAPTRMVVEDVYVASHNPDLPTRQSASDAAPTTHGVGMSITHRPAAYGRQKREQEDAANHPTPNHACPSFAAITTGKPCPGFIAPVFRQTQSKARAARALRNQKGRSKRY